MRPDFRQKEVFWSEVGTRIHIIYGPKVEPDGSVSIVPVGKEDIQSRIEAARSSTDMAYILKQLELGNDSVLSARDDALFGDFTQMPRTYAELLQLQIDARRTFDSLPLDVRNRFDNNCDKFVALAGTDPTEFFRKLNDSSKEVTADES